MTESSPSPETFSSHTVRIDNISPSVFSKKAHAVIYKTANIIQKIVLISKFDEELKYTRNFLIEKFENYKNIVNEKKNISKYEDYLSLTLKILEYTEKTNEFIDKKFKEKPPQKEIKEKLSEYTNLVDEQIQQIIEEYKVKKEKTNLNEFIPALVKDIREGLPDRIHHIRVLNPDDNIYYNLDHRLTKKIIENFIYNSAKYSPEGSNIFVSFSEDQEEVTISVKDFGIGFNKQELDVIENNPNFYNAFSYAIKQGASIEVSSAGKNQGLGSTFSIIFKK